MTATPCIQFLSSISSVIGFRHSPLLAVQSRRLPSTKIRCSCLPVDPAHHFHRSTLEKTSNISVDFFQLKSLILVQCDCIVSYCNCESNRAIKSQSALHEVPKQANNMYQSLQMTPNGQCQSLHISHMTWFQLYSSNSEFLQNPLTKTY